MKNSPRKRNPVLWLVVGVPLVGILVSITALYLAFGVPDQGVSIEELPMSKTSWRETP